MYNYHYFVFLILSQSFINIIIDYNVAMAPQPVIQ